ncbi:MAG: signal peptidase II [Chloroflexi bacterium]|nr:signal peptidase II [Chloroflexota bacterium]
MNELDQQQTAVIETAPPSLLQPATVSERLLLFVIALFTIGIDQYSKIMVETKLALFEVYAPIPSLEAFFRIFHISNTGSAFGLFEGGSIIFRYLAIIVSLGIIYYNQILPGKQRLLRLALGLQMGGALGNMIDRFRIGHVTDFIDIGPWYIFNLADLAVVSGALILGWLVWQEGRELRAAQEREKEFMLETAYTDQRLKSQAETAVPVETGVLPPMDSNHE